MVEATVSTLLNQIDKKTTHAQRLTIECPLIVRSSARIPEGWKDERL